MQFTSWCWQVTQSSRKKTFHLCEQVAAPFLAYLPWKKLWLITPNTAFWLINSFLPAGKDVLITPLKICKETLQSSDNYNTICSIKILLTSKDLLGNSSANLYLTCYNTSIFIRVIVVLHFIINWHVVPKFLNSSIFWCVQLSGHCVQTDAKSHGFVDTYYIPWHTVLPILPCGEWIGKYIVSV